MPKKKNAQLTQGDRMTIEIQLRDHEKIPQIARRLGVSPTTVTREIQRNRVKETNAFLYVKTRNICLRRDVCKKAGVCGNGCIMPCRTCKKWLCNTVCPDFLPDQCPNLTKPPFVCNGCGGLYGGGCDYEYLFYDGRLAHDIAQNRKRDSRSGIDITEEELERIRSLVREPLKKGQSPEFIWHTLGDQLSISLSTFYRYINMGLFSDISGPDLPKKVRMKPRSKKQDPPVPRHSMKGRTYADFEALSDDERLSAVEMDCVEGKRGDKPAILTLLFRRFNFQLMLYLAEKTQAEVAKALDLVERLTGPETFKALFGIILTDRGSEFLDYDLLEKSFIAKTKRCRVFYCDPMESGQKGKCEKNHSELRRIIPKGTSFAKLTPAKLSIVCSHVNSYGRPQFGGASPYQLASQVLPASLLDGLSIGYVEPADVTLKPSLIDL